MDRSKKTLADKRIDVKLKKNRVGRLQTDYSGGLCNIEGGSRGCVIKIRFLILYVEGL